MPSHHVELKDPLAAVPPSRHPFQIWAMVACTLGGISALFIHVPGSVYDLLPDWAVLLWGGILLGGGLLAVVSAWWPDRIIGLLLERTALTAIAVGATVYGIAVVSVRGMDGLIPVAMTLSIGIASAWRVKHVSVELTKTRLWLEGIAGDFPGDEGVDG